MKTLTLLLVLLSNTLMAQAPLPSRTILFIGDSLTEGYGVAREASYPHLLGKMIEKDGQFLPKIINGSVSGSTSAGAVSRLKWYERQNVQVLVLALGANDGLRGVKVSETKKNLGQAIEYAKSKGMKVILPGMLMPPNYGPDYTKDFKAMYESLSREHKIVMVPFLLEGVAGETKLNQDDGIHPNEAGHLKMAENVYPYLRGLL
jgi:acyl-CoA thioesterase-1